jgi:hypothetical protein
MIDRRAFMSSSALVALAPRLSFASALPAPPAAEATRLVVKIAGWSQSDESNPSEEIWIRVNHSWRAAWR